MESPVHRFLLAARPARNHPQYRPWETADICVFIGGENHDRAFDKLEVILKERCWELLRLERQDVLIEERIRQQGGEIWKDYQTAQELGHHISEFPQHFGAGSGRRPTAPPRFNEPRVDAMVADAGGRRLTETECGSDDENADYLLDNHVVELKEIREEVFGDDKVQRQQKLAALFIPYHRYDSEIQIDRSILSPEDAQRFDDLVGGPIQRSIKKAAAQVRATKARLGLSDWKGAVILVNSGSFTMSAKQCFRLAQRYASKDTSQIQEVVCIEQAYRTNSFDCQTSSTFLPRSPRSEFAERLFYAWSKQIHTIMGDWAQAGFRNEADCMEPPIPVQFLALGRVFSWTPELPPSSWLGNRAAR